MLRNAFGVTVPALEDESSGAIATAPSNLAMTTALLKSHCLGRRFP
jgi:hypothetical protein